MDGTRPSAAEAYWRLPLRWNQATWEDRKRQRVFCGSLMDFFEARPDLFDHRRRALDLAYACQSLDWMFLTKRPHLIRTLLQAAEPSGQMGEIYPSYLDVFEQETPRHFWLGTTCEDQEWADRRIPRLEETNAALRFLSCEPLLGPLDLSGHLKRGGIGWVIVGGESNQGGARARPMEMGWVEEIVGACRQYRVPVFVKQLGDNAVADERLFPLKMLNHHGRDPEEWPEWLRVREVPAVRKIDDVFG